MHQSKNVYTHFLLYTKCTCMWQHQGTGVTTSKNGLKTMLYDEQAGYCVPCRLIASLQGSIIQEFKNQLLDIS